VCACLVAALLAARADATAAPAGFFGVGGWSYPSAAQSASLGAAGVRLVRGAVGWGVVQPSPDAASRNWSDPDRLAREAAANGYNVIFDINGCAVWACGTVDAAPTTGAALAAYESFVRAAAARYAPRSAFWRGQRRIPRITWQVWNEVNGGVFWPDPTPASYAAFFTATAAAIRAVDPHAAVVMSGLDALPSVSSGMTLGRFLSGLYAQPGFAAATSAIAVEAYAPTPAAAIEVLDEARRVVLAHHDGAKPMWVTEMGWATAGPPYPFTVSPAMQARYLTRTWRAMLACRARWNLRHVLWFSLQDASPATFGQPDGWSFHDGLLNLDGSPKRAYRSFLSLVGTAASASGAGRCRLPRGVVR
jgi:Cellulase (glycosyl hydrolase family 5)